MDTKAYLRASKARYASGIRTNGLLEFSFFIRAIRGRIVLLYR